MKTVAMLGKKGGTSKTATSHLLCLGAYLQGIPAAYVLTDPERKVRGDGRPYAVLDGRLPDQLALIFTSSQSNLNGWLVIDGGGNRPDFDIEIGKNADLSIIPFRPSEEDIDTVAQSLAVIPNALAWPSAWPTNAFAVTAAEYLLEGLGKAFPQRVMSSADPLCEFCIRFAVCVACVTVNRRAPSCEEDVFDDAGLLRNPLPSRESCSPVPSSLRGRGAVPAK